MCCPGAVNSCLLGFCVSFTPFHPVPQVTGSPPGWRPSRVPGPQAGLQEAASLLRGAAPLRHRSDYYFTSLSIFSLQQFTICTVLLKCNTVVAKCCISTLTVDVSDSRCRDNVRACEVSQLGSRSAAIQPAAAPSLGVWAPLVGQGTWGHFRVSFSAGHGEQSQRRGAWSSHRGEK